MSIHKNNSIRRPSLCTDSNSQTFCSEYLKISRINVFNNVIFQLCIIIT